MDLTIYRARTNKINIWVRDDNGDAYDLTGCTLWMTAKREYTDADSVAIFQLSSPSGGITITSEEQGQAQATVSPANTQALPYSEKIVYFDLQLKTATAEYWSIAQGRFKVMPNITRNT